jgi:hypothetical protein
MGTSSMKYALELINPLFDPRERNRSEYAPVIKILSRILIPILANAAIWQCIQILARSILVELNASLPSYSTCTILNDNAFLLHVAVVAQAPLKCLEIVVRRPIDAQVTNPIDSLNLLRLSD